MKRFIITLLFISSCFLLKAQLQDRSQRPNQDEIESRKIAFLATALTLTPVEAARFWPVYNEWNKKMEENMRTRHAALRKIRQLSRDKSMDEKNYAQQSKILIDGATEEARISSEAHRAYLSIIGEIRTAKLYLAEEQFREILIRELRQSAYTEANKPR